MTYTPTRLPVSARAIRAAIKAGDAARLLEMAGLLIDELDALAALSEDLEPVCEDEGAQCDDEGFDCDHEPDCDDEGEAQALCHHDRDPAHPWPPLATDTWSNHP